MDAIVVASFELLASRGLAGLTTNHIAERAGVSVGSVYRYFPDKQSIVAELNVRLRREAIGRFLNAVAEFPEDFPGNLERALYAFFDLTEERSAVRRIMMRSVPLEWVEAGAAEAFESIVEPTVRAVLQVNPNLDAATLSTRMLVAIHAVQGVSFAVEVWAPEVLTPKVAARELARMLVPYFTT